MWDELEKGYHVWQSNNLNVTLRVLGKQEGTNRNDYSVSVSCPELHPTHKDYGSFDTLEKAKVYALDFARRVLTTNVARLDIALDGLETNDRETKAERS